MPLSELPNSLGAKLVNEVPEAGPVFCKVAGQVQPATLPELPPDELLLPAPPVPDVLPVEPEDPLELEVSLVVGALLLFDGA